VILSILLNLFPQIQNSSMILAAGILAMGIEIYGFLRGRAGDDEPAAVAGEKMPGPVRSDVLQTINSPQTNIFGNVQGEVLSGKFEGPVATGAGGEAVDMRNSSGTIYKPSGRVEQHIGDEITQIIQREKLPPPAIPSPPEDFTGREEELEEILKAFKPGANITSLWGAGGIGKTALALMLAKRLKSRFSDGQIFLKLEGTSPNPLKPANAMAHVIRAFRGSDERLPENQNELQGLYNSVFGGKCVLLLLDNAADDRQVLPLLPPADCAVLVTSRYKFTLPGMPEPFSLDVMKPAEARELLLRICPRIGDQAGELAGLCGFLPLALRAAASLLAVKSDVIPSGYLEELRSERTRLKKIGREGVDLGVESSLDLSYRRLEPETAAIFGLLSVFPADFDAAAEEVICLDEGHRYLSELVRWSLVEFDSATGRYHLHDLVRIFAASRLPDGEKMESEERHAGHYRRVLSASDELYQLGGKNVLASLALFDREWANIRAGWAWAERNPEISPAAESLCGSYPDAGAYVLDLRLHPKERIRWRETALVAARRQEDQRRERNHLGSLGLAYAALGNDLQAIKYYQQALAISREIRDQRGEGNSLGNLGNAYVALGEPRKAIEYHQKALAISREIEDRKSEGADLGNLGNVYYALGEPCKAIEHYEQALAIAKEIGDRRGEGIRLGNLGSAYSCLGEIRKAIEHHEQALNIAQEIGDRRNEGIWLAKLGEAYSNLGEPLNAIDYYKQALGISVEIVNRRYEGVYLGMLGSAYVQLDDLSKAIKYYDQALSIARKTEDRTNEGNWLGNLGIAYLLLGKIQKAIGCFEEALDIAQEIGDQRNEGNWLGNLGLAYADLGESLKAIEHYQQQLSITQEIGDRSGEGNALWSMSLAQDSLSKRSEAVKLAKDVLAIYEQIESPYAEKVRRQLAEWQGES
jgi:tetratricopeptide (TPR) repeat protein